jgi:regulator of protease activity HflC (stomatin/prohibitin superfamily)
MHVYVCIQSKGEDPELVKSFAYNLTARGLAQQLKDAQEEAVRRLGRAVNHTEVYGLRSVETQTSVADVAGLKPDTDDEEGLGGKVTDAMKRQLNDQFNKYGVQITDVAITNVRLPKEFTRQMQEKTTYASIISEQKMKQENDMQLL